MKNTTKIIMCVVVLSFFVATSLRVVAEDPVIGDVNISPTNPTVQSTITVTVNVTGEDIAAVHFIYKECDEELCKYQQNSTMTQVSLGAYQSTITLVWDKATHMTYHFEINSNGSWTTTNDVDVILASIPGNNTNGTNGNGDNQQSPGFEIVITLVALGLLLVVLRRKRSR